ncbi:MAG: hypothetical protein GX267_05180 [Fibrobacter sp.]|jgi:malate dehydrogenase (oxaloacetate-decarboxylating)(NADP+)|nr:hypothetical protein [Fibrobacter sp.]
MNHSENAYRFESNNNKIAVVTNGTAIDTMEYSVKTYMEAIAEVYKSAGLDIFGIELNTRNLLEIKNSIVSLQQDFGAVLIAGIKAPGCYQLLNMVKQELTIPVILEVTGVAVAIGATILNISKDKNKLLNEMRFLCLGCNELKRAVLEQLFLIGADPSLVVSCRKGGFEYAAYASHFSDIVMVFDFQYEHIKRIAMELPSNPVLMLLSHNLSDHISKLAKVRPDAFIIPYDSIQSESIEAALSGPYLLRNAIDQKLKKITPDMLKSASMSLVEFAQSNRLLPELMDWRSKSVF